MQRSLVQIPDQHQRGVSNRRFRMGRQPLFNLLDRRIVLVSQQQLPQVMQQRQMFGQFPCVQGLLLVRV